MSRAGLKIQTPRGCISTVQTKNGKITARLEWNPGFGPEMSGKLNKAQVFVDSEVLRYSDPYVPMDTGMLKQSGILGTELGSGEVIYNAPYAKKQYYSNRGNGMRGKLWFERMKADHKDDILRGAAKIAGGEPKA